MEENVWHPLALLEKRHREFFEEHGYLVLGKLLSQEGLVSLRRRADDFMHGRVHHEGMQFQLDGDNEIYRNLQKKTERAEVDTLGYRRIDGLHHDPRFLTYLQHPVFRQITRRYIGDNVSVYRTMLMNKPARGGTELPWHQDVGHGWGLDRDPVITVWTALDDATYDSGCMQLVPGSHRLGVLNENHFASDADIALHVSPSTVIDLEVEAGDAVLLHNWTLHRSDVNRTDNPRRAFSVAYMDAETRHAETGETFPIVFGEGALHPQADE